MESVAIQATVAAAFAVLLAAIAWLAHCLKRKNRQLKRALAHLHTVRNELAQKRAPVVVLSQTEPVAVVSQPKPISTNTSHVIVDAFLWEHLGDAFLWKHLANPKPAPIEITRRADTPFPSGMCTPAELEQLLSSDPPFTGLVILIAAEEGQAHGANGSIENFVQGLLGPSDLACHRSDDEFLVICPGLHAASAQRWLNGFSESLWGFQLRGSGAFSLLFSWGGIGVENEPLSQAIASATDRMRQTKRNRLIFFSRKAG